MEDVVWNRRQAHVPHHILLFYAAREGEASENQIRSQVSLLNGYELEMKEIQV